MHAAILLKVREREKITIGRNTAELPANTIRINSQYISSRHCQLIPENGKLTLTDSSRNGTWVSSTNPGSATSEASSPSMHIKSINNIRNKTVPLEPNTYIIFIPPNLSKILTEIVGLHFTGLDPSREFYHLECIKHNSMLENRQLMMFFNHMGFGKDFRNGFCSIVSTDLTKQTRKRTHPRSGEIENTDSKVLSFGKSTCDSDCKSEGGVDSKTLKIPIEKEEVFSESSKDLENNPPSKSAKIELEQCQFCLKDFPLIDLIVHSEKCHMEQSETLKLPNFIKNSSKLKLIKERTMETCMKCFKDFPLSELIQHSEICKVSLIEKSLISFKFKRRNSSPF